MEPIRNQLLCALPPDTLARLLPKLNRVTLTVRTALITPNERIEAVYFLEGGWASMVAQLDDGTQAEVGLIGREGAVGRLLPRGLRRVLPRPISRLRAPP